MEKEDVPVWILLSDTFPHWRGAGSPPLSRGREGHAGRWHGSQFLIITTWHGENGQD